MTRYDLEEFQKNDIEDDKYYVTKDSVDVILNNIESEINYLIDDLNKIGSISDLGTIEDVRDKLTRLAKELY